MAEDIKRLVCNEIHQCEKDSTSTVIEQQTFGYPYVDAIIGCDHGAGHSQFIVKTNLKSSEVEKKQETLNFVQVIVCPAM